MAFRNWEDIVTESGHSVYSDWGDGFRAGWVDARQGKSQLETHGGTSEYAHGYREGWSEASDRIKALRHKIA